MPGSAREAVGRLFEEVVNLVHELAQSASIAFNATLDDIVTAAQRRLSSS